MRSTSQRAGTAGFRGAILCLVVAAVTIVFGARARYTPPVYWSIAAVQAAAMLWASWFAGASALRAADGATRSLALAGSLLVSPWFLFAFLPGIGAPGDQTAAENQLRYTLLLVNSILCTAGLVALRQALHECGERTWSLLGLVTALAALPLYVVWAAILLFLIRAIGAPGSRNAEPWLAAFMNLSDVLLFFGGVLFYAATVCFALALGRVRWLGRAVARAYVVAAGVAILCLLARGPEFPDPAVAFQRWYRIPGFVAGIPAIPWILPCLIGIACLQRAARATGDARS